MSDTTAQSEPFAMLPISVLLDSGLSDKAVRLYALLVHYVGTNGSCWPSQGRLADQMGTTTRTVQRTLDELVAARLVRVERGTRRTCRYYLTYDTGDAPPTTPVSPPPTTPTSYKEEPVNKNHEQEPVMEAPMRQTDRPQPITDTWTPDRDVMDRLAHDCEGLVNLDRSLRRFRNYHIEKGTRSRAWDHKFEAWVLNDLDKTERETKPTETGPDEFGMMPWQHKAMADARPTELHPDIAAALAKVIELDERRPA